MTNKGDEDIVSKVVGMIVSLILVSFGLYIIVLMMGSVTGRMIIASVSAFIGVVIILWIMFDPNQL